MADEKNREAKNNNRDYLHCPISSKIKMEISTEVREEETEPGKKEKKRLNLGRTFQCHSFQSVPEDILSSL